MRRLQRLALALALACAAAAPPLAAAVRPPPFPPPSPPAPAPPVPPTPPTPPPTPPGPPVPQAEGFPPEGKDNTKLYYVFGGILGFFAVSLVRAQHSTRCVSAFSVSLAAGSRFALARPAACALRCARAPRAACPRRVHARAPRARLCAAFSAFSARQRPPTHRPKITPPLPPPSPPFPPPPAQFIYCMYSARDKMREAKKEYMDVVARREFMEAQMALTAVGRKQLAAIRESRGEDPLTGKKKKPPRGGAAGGASKGVGGSNKDEAAEEGKEAGKGGDAATIGLGLLAGVAMLA
jgi:hypothetical protein